MTCILVVSLYKEGHNQQTRCLERYIKVRCKNTNKINTKSFRIRTKGTRREILLMSVKWKKWYFAFFGTRKSKSWFQGYWEMCWRLVEEEFSFLFLSKFKISSDVAKKWRKALFNLRVIHKPSGQFFGKFKPPPPKWPLL